jgi:hypothetical protein
MAEPEVETPLKQANSSTSTEPAAAQETSPPPGASETTAATAAGAAEPDKKAPEDDTAPTGDATAKGTDKNANEGSREGAEANTISATQAAAGKQQQEHAPGNDKQASEQPVSEDAKETQATKESKAEPEAEVTLEQLQAALSGSNFKSHNALEQVQKNLNSFRQQVDDSAGELKQQAETLQGQLQELLDKNQQHQEQLAAKTRQLIDTLQQALEAGQSHEALPTWDKIQGNISNTSGKIRSKLQEASNPFKAKLNELRDWKIFAATEKKRELITRMQALLESKLTPQEANKRIGKMHREWKALGQSNDNESLWKEFKTLSDKAYEPCKEYFKQRKQLMAENLRKRQEICAQMEAELEKLDPEAIHIGELNKLLNRCEKQWKQYAPVEQSKIKSIQKRYYGLVNEFRKHRKKSIRENATSKQALIDRAVELASSGDSKQAMNEAKQLQKQWQSVGPTTFKDDKKLWSDFRAACDKIFAKRDAASQERKQQQQQQRQDLQQLLTGMEALLKKPEEAFRESRAEAHELARQFNSKLDGQQRRAHSKLIDRFNDLKRQIDARFRSLPDKKTQAMRQQISKISTALDLVEQQLFGSDKDSFAGIASSIDSELGSTIDALEEREVQQLLEQRLQLLGKDSAAFTVAAEAAEKAFRELCIAAEIRADMETPAEDQARRMQLQLEKLQEDFGQARPSQKDNSRFALQAETRALCLGPLPSELRESLSKRLEQTLSRLR